MIPTPFALYKYFDGDETYNNYDSFCNDLFGILNWGPYTKNKEELNNNITMFYGLYKGLYLQGISAKEIYRCYLNNNLDYLINSKYYHPLLSHGQYASGYYKDYCEKKIYIGKTFLDEDSDEEDYEESEENIKPYIYSNINRQYHLFTNDVGKNNIKIQYENKKLDTIFKDKIYKCKYSDKLKERLYKEEEYINIDDIKKLIEKQDRKCYVCGDNLIFNNWYSECLYQFTLDRINEKLPHNKNNVLLCCYYCNCFSYTGIDDDICKYKMCKNGCHTIKRNIIRTRKNIDYKEINKLLLKI